MHTIQSKRAPSAMMFNGKPARTNRHWTAILRKAAVAALCVGIGLLVFVRAAYALEDDVLGFLVSGLFLVTVVPVLMPRTHRVPSQGRAL